MKQNYQEAIEEKNAALALLNDDLKNRENENVVLQAQRDVYQAQLQKCQDQIGDLIINRHVPLANDPGKDNIVMIIEKNTVPEEDEFYECPYYIVRIQRRFIRTKRRWFDQHFPDHEIIVEIDNPNSIHTFNRFIWEGHVVFSVVLGLLILHVMLLMP